MVRGCAGLCCALLMLGASDASAQSDRGMGILTGEERAQYEASLAFCSQDANRDTSRCRRFERAFPNALTPQDPAPDEPPDAEPPETEAPEE